MSQPNYDSVWKALPDEVILALARLVEPDIGTTIQPWKSDIKLLFDRELDRAYLVDVREQRALLHLEYQNYLDKTMPFRMFHYTIADKLQYYQQYQEDVLIIGIVIWAVSGATPAPIYESAVTSGKGITSGYHEIHLSELDWQGVDPLLLVLAPFLHGVAVTNLEEVAVRMYEAASLEHRTLLLGALLNLSRRTYHDIDDIEQAILQRVRTTMDEIIEAIAEGPIGIKLIARGKEEGKAEGLHIAATIMWEHRLGSLPPDIEPLLAKASAEHIQRLLEYLADSPNEVGARAILAA